MPFTSTSSAKFGSRSENRPPRPKQLSKTFSNLKIQHAINKQQLAASLTAATAKDTFTANMTERPQNMAQAIGQLQHLRTRAEVTAADSTMEVYFIDLPIKYSNGLLKYLKESIPKADDLEINHLRRFVRPETLPDHVRERLPESPSDFASRILIEDGTVEAYLSDVSYSSTDNDSDTEQVSEQPLPPPEVVATTVTNVLADVTNSNTNSENVPPPPQNGEKDTPTGSVTSSVKKYKNRRRRGRKTLSSGHTTYFVICPASVISEEDLTKVLKGFPRFSAVEADPEFMTTTVPAATPTSAAQAERWSQLLWPTIYKSTNPYGPHPSLVKRAQDEVIPNVGKWMAIAREAATESLRTNPSTGGCTGEPIGCVVVERLPDGEQRIVVVAGDARFSGLWFNGISAERTVANANINGHAAMRAIGMIGRIRRRIAAPSFRSMREPVLQDVTKDATNTTNTANDAEAVPTRSVKPPLRRISPPRTESEPAGSTLATVNVDHIFLDLPMTDLERHHFESDTSLTPNGYLCLDLEIYLTHEPCIMCSMAILHSRFGRCVFGQRMPLTGGLTAEGQPPDYTLPLDPSLWRPTPGSTKMEAEKMSRQESTSSEASAASSVPVGSLPKDTASLGYGLFWRPESLNWRFLVWEWKDEDAKKEETATIGDTVHV